MNKTRSKVMTIANRLVKQGLTRSIATVKAWLIVKANALRTKVKGTSRRQDALEKLAGVNPADISVKLKREPHNVHDSNAIAVYVALRDNRVFFIGYLPIHCITDRGFLSSILKGVFKMNNDIIMSVFDKYLSNAFKGIQAISSRITGCA